MKLRISTLLLLPLTAFACAEDEHADQATFAQTEVPAACVPGAMATVTDGAVNVRSAAMISPDTELGLTYEGTRYLVSTSTPVFADEHWWVPVQRGTTEAWIAADFVGCSAPQPCPAGQTRHAYVKRDERTRDDGAPVHAARDEASAQIRILPFAQRVTTLSRSDDGWVEVLLPSFDESGGADRIVGYMRTEELAQDFACTPDGLATKDVRGATVLLGQYELVRGGGSNNARNAILGFNRTDARTVAPGGTFNYLRDPDPNLGIISPRDSQYACDSNDDCPATHVCRMDETSPFGNAMGNNRCGRYFDGGTNDGGTIWASGVCGTATITHRAALDAALMPLEYTTHFNFPGAYIYPGVDAEVYWANDGDPAGDQNYRFVNDTDAELVIVTGSRIGTAADANAGDASGSRVGKLIVSMQIWGTSREDRYASYTVEHSTSHPQANAPSDDGCLELVRDVTRLGERERFSPFEQTHGGVDGYPGLRSIRLIDRWTEARGEQVASTERWHITSCYSGPKAERLTPTYSRHHP